MASLVRTLSGFFGNFPEEWQKCTIACSRWFGADTEVYFRVLSVFTAIPVKILFFHLEDLRDKYTMEYSLKIWSCYINCYACSTEETFQDNCGEMFPSYRVLLVDHEQMIVWMWLQLPVFKGTMVYHDYCCINMVYNITTIVSHGSYFFQRLLNWRILQIKKIKKPLLTIWRQVPNYNDDLII